MKTQAPKPSTAQDSHHAAAGRDAEGGAVEAAAERTSAEASADPVQQAHRQIIARVRKQAPGLGDLPDSYLLEIAERIEKRAPSDDALRKQARYAQKVRMSNVLLLAASLLTTTVPIIVTVWSVTTLVSSGTVTPPLPPHWPVLNWFTADRAVTTLSALFAANAAINVALAVSSQSTHRLDQVYETLWRTDLTRVAGAAAFAATCVLLLFAAGGGDDRNPATIFATVVLTALTIALAITCDQRENSITRTEHFHAATNSLNRLNTWQEYLKRQRVPTSYRGPGRCPQTDRYRTWPVLFVIAAIALICMAVFVAFTVAALGARPATMLVTLCIGAVLSLGATWAFLFQFYIRWTTVTETPERSLTGIALLDKIFVVGLPVCAILLALFPEGRIGATVVIGIVAGPVVLSRAISRSLHVEHSPVIDFLAWPVWGRVHTELRRKEDLLAQSAGRRFIQEFNVTESTLCGQHTAQKPIDIGLADH